MHPVGFESWLDARISELRQCASEAKVKELRDVIVQRHESEMMGLRQENIQLKECLGILVEAPSNHSQGLYYGRKLSEEQRIVDIDEGLDLHFASQLESPLVQFLGGSKEPVSKNGKAAPDVETKARVPSKASSDPNWNTNMSVSSKVSSASPGQTKLNVPSKFRPCPSPSSLSSFSARGFGEFPETAEVFAIQEDNSREKLGNGQPTVKHEGADNMNAKHKSSFSLPVFLLMFCVVNSCMIVVLVVIIHFAVEHTCVVWTAALGSGMFVIGAFIGLLVTWQFMGHRGDGDKSCQSPQELLHWVDGDERRGCGDLILKVNHIAIIVADVGRSLTFYTEVIGFQQIRRPNFDRHGAWLTMGNLELHLIKGKPVVHDGEDLIVSHIALETDRPDLVLEKLISMNVAFRQNVSVPDPKASMENTGQEDFSSSKGKVMQFFVRDPDGYYLELCNCDILTKFCLMKEDDEASRNKLKFYAEGWAQHGMLKITILFKCAVRLVQIKVRVRENLKLGFDEHLRRAIKGVQKASVVDEVKLERLLKRTKTYCDITQGYSRTQLEQALILTGNAVPLALLALKADRGERRVCIPPSYLLGEDDGAVTKTVSQSLQPRRFSIPVVIQRLSKHLGKDFADREASAQDAAIQFAEAKSVLGIAQKFFMRKSRMLENEEQKPIRMPKSRKTLRTEVLQVIDAA